MNTSLSRALACAASLAAAATLSARADELADRGRDIFKKNQSAVVTVQVVLKTKYSLAGMGAQANESKQDLTGTVVDPSGLTVLALSATDPTGLVQNLMATMSSEDLKFKFDTELADVKILLEDGTELPAEVVLRDKDLDLAYVRPKSKPARPMPSVDLSQSASAQVLDHVVTLNRLGQAAGRAYAVSVERITAVVQKPRLFYIPETSLASATLGSPAFTTDGKILGVFVLRSIAAKTGGGFNMFNFEPEGLTAIILPAADILKGAKQAPETKPADEKPDAPPAEKKETK
jgi:S1-C subfamily serine protease